MILVDCDVLSHFIKGGQIMLLPTIFQNPMRVLEQVEEELRRYKSKSNTIDQFFNSYPEVQLSFPSDTRITKEYFELYKNMGKGESACLAMARFTKDIVASSNIKDIQTYCQNHNIQYLTTMDFLCEAMKTGKLSEVQCDTFITDVLSAGSRLPVTQMSMYSC